jgi:hypothetical protein
MLTAYAPVVSPVQVGTCSLLHLFPCLAGKPRQNSPAVVLRFPHLLSDCCNPMQYINLSIFRFSTNLSDESAIFPAMLLLGFKLAHLSANLGAMEAHSVYRPLPAPRPPAIAIFCCRLLLSSISCRRFWRRFWWVNEGYICACEQVQPCLPPQFHVSSCSMTSKCTSMPFGPLPALHYSKDRASRI